MEAQSVVEVWWEPSTASLPFSENLSHGLGHCELAPEGTPEFKSRLEWNPPFPWHVYNVVKYVLRDGGEVSFQGLQKSLLGQLTWRDSCVLKYGMCNNYTAFKKILAWKAKLYIV